MSERAIATREFAVTTEESALPYIVTAASKSEAREAIESQHLRVMWVEHRRSQCDKCKRWAQASTVKTQAGVTFCTNCQSDFVDWVAAAATDKATARPWLIGNRIGGVFNEPDRYISDERSGGTLAVATAHGSNNAEADANAELIVRAVNSHDALVEALRLARPALDYLAEKDPEHWQRDAEVIEAALALAEAD